MQASRHAPAMVAALIAMCGAAPAASADFPARPVKVVVGFSAGGPTDILARIVGPALAQQLGQSVVIENKAGASGTIAAKSVIESGADGHTLFLATEVDMAIVPHLIAPLPFDPHRDLKPVVAVGEQYSVFVVRKDAPLKSLQDLVSRAKARPRTISYASAGNGSPSHMVGALFAVAAGVELNHVPYKGAGPASADLLGGHVDAMFLGGPAALNHIRSGALRALAVTGRKRATQMPDVPTFAEAGLDREGLDSGTWFALAAPAGVPAAAMERLSAAWMAASRQPEMAARLEQQGLLVRAEAGDTVAGWIKRDYARWGQVIKAAGIKAN